MPKRSKLPLRKNTEGYFVDGKGNILAHISEHGYLIFPGGGIEGSESVEETILRETREETGAIIAKPLTFLTKLEFLWGPDWAKTEKQKQRYQKYKGEEMYFFTGKIATFVPHDAEDGWRGKKLMPISEAIKFMEQQTPLLQHTRKYKETQLNYLKRLAKPHH